MAETTDELKQTLLDRAQPEVERTPMAPPRALPSLPNHTPPAWQRYITGQKMQQAYRNNWNPNPVLLGILDKGK